MKYADIYDKKLAARTDSAAKIISQRFDSWIKDGHKEKVKEFLSIDDDFFPRASKAVRADRELCEVAIRNAGDAYRYISDALKKDVQLAALAVISNHTVINDTPRQVLEAREYWVIALAGDYRLSSRLPVKFKEDKELFVIAAEQFKANSLSNPKGSWYIPYDVNLSEQFGPGVQAIVKGKTLTQAINSCRAFVQAERNREALSDEVPQVPRQPARRMKI